MKTKSRKFIILLSMGLFLVFFSFFAKFFDDYSLSNNSSSNLDVNSENVLSMSYNYAIKAQILQRKGKYEKSLKNINKAIGLNPSEANHFSDLANSLIWMNQYEEALKAVNKAIELEPETGRYYSELACILSFLKQYEDAIETINIAIKIDPQNIRYYKQKSQYLAYYLYKYKSALKVIEAAFKLNPDKLCLFELYEVQAGILLSMKNREVAIKVIRKARQLCPNKEIYPNLH